MQGELNSGVEVVTLLGAGLGAQSLDIGSPEAVFARGLASILLGLSLAELAELRDLAKQQSFVNGLSLGPSQRAMTAIGSVSEEGWTLLMQARRSVEGRSGSLFATMAGTPGHDLLLSAVAMALRSDRALIKSSPGMHEEEITAEARDNAARMDVIFDNFAFFWAKVANRFDTIEKLATAASVSPVTIYGLKHRKARPQMRTLVKIARTLGVELEQLLQPRKQ